MTTGRVVRRKPANYCVVSRRLSRHLLVRPTGALPAIKPEATDIGLITRWQLENNPNV